MTIDEAIKHCEEVAEAKEKEGSLNQESFMPLDDFMKYRVECLKCANDHRQLAEWLRELEKYRESWEHLFATIFEIKSNAENEEVRNLANFLLKYMRIYEKEIRGVNADEEESESE